MHISEIANTNHQNEEQLNVDLDEKSSQKDKQDTPEEILSFFEQEQELNEVTELYSPSEKVCCANGQAGTHTVQSHDVSVDNDGENGQEKEMEAKEGQVELVQNENTDLRQTQIADLREDTETDEEQTEDEAEDVCDKTDEEKDESEEPGEQTEEEERKGDESRHEEIIQAGKDGELEAITEGESNKESAGLNVLVIQAHITKRQKFVQEGRK